MTKVYLKDAYFMIPVNISHRWMLRLLIKECHYQFTCLPFGLSSTPWVFTKTFKKVTTMLRELGGGDKRERDGGDKGERHGGCKGDKRGTGTIMVETREQVRDHTL